MTEIYNYLGLKPINKNLSLTKIKKKLPVNKISNYNCILKLFSENNLTYKTLNNENSIIKIIKKKKNININGSIYKCVIKSKTKYKYKTIFIKESPLFNLQLLNIDLLDLENYNYTFKKSIVMDYLNSKDSSANIELFCSYITSKLVEKNISPHFSLFYGSNYVEMNKFTFEISKEWLDINLDILEKKNIKVFKNQNKYYLEKKNLPCILIYLEKLKIDLYDYIETKLYIPEEEWTSYLFQIICALSIMQKYFNLHHNDLHLSNIMCNYTKNEYLYYKYNNIYYKVPTYNKIIKIIDWGRASYNFNNFKSNNYCFSVNGDAFGQYYNNRINNKGKYSENYNSSLDLYILSRNLINIDNFPKKGRLYNLIKKWINYEIDEIDNITFNDYVYGVKKAFRCIPSEQIKSSIFKKYIVDKNEINKTDRVFPL
uniref:Protein kinase domain-containing protein n=1 Tax=viral metagenome TaxID=1070528 RepID=A0A6C0J1F3_9ZZZZ